MPKIKRRSILFLVVVFILAVFLVSFLRQKYVVPILMYHSVNPGAQIENRLAVSVEAFNRQMRFLKRHRYNVLPLEELANLIKDKKRLPPKSTAITFDDGYKDNYIYAFPVLKKYNLPATIFVIINEVNRPDRLNWDEIKVMQESGLITFGSHTLGPEPLVNPAPVHRGGVNIKSEDELKRQIFESKRGLEEKLNRRVSMFSYPEGRFNAKIKQLVIDAGYKLAVATSPGKRFANDDIFALKRLRISSTSNNLFVFAIETSGLYTFIKERRDED